MTDDTKLGAWRWYVGMDEQDDQMMDSGTREKALADGRQMVSAGQPFYIVEARMFVADEEEMSNGERESSPFAQIRNGEWIDA